MIKPCRKVLKGLRSLADNTETKLTFLGGHALICVDGNYNAGYDYSKYKGEIHSIISQLAEDKFINYKDDSNFTLTQRGLHPYRFTGEALRHFLLTSIFIPVVVSFFTTVVTLLVKEWLSTLL